MTEPLAPQYNPTAIESALYAWWEERGLFSPDVTAGVPGDGRPYVIMMPPPNVTAALHMGHGLNNTVQDVLVRFERMRGRRALWLPGTDHAGIATQNVVERIVATEGRTRFDLGREAFVDRVWAYVRETGAAILTQLRALGCSADWSRTYFTLDEGLSRAVREAFVRLYDEGLVYRGHYIINWCPRCLTALSNEEAEKEEVDGQIWHLRYPAADGNGHVTVATTRPETMLGDTAVAVHPGDERYRALIGRQLRLPVVDRLVPVVADEAVDPAFGTGAVKVTPAHDPAELVERPACEPLDLARGLGGAVAHASESTEALPPASSTSRRRYAVTASRFPFTRSGGTGSTSAWEPSAANVSCEMRIPPTGAAVWRRAARFTTSPTTPCLR